MKSVRKNKSFTFIKTLRYEKNRLFSVGCELVVLLRRHFEGGGNSGKEVIPSVTLENVTPDSGDPSVLEVTIAPEDAVACAYVCYPETEAAYDAGQIFASGKAVDADVPTTVTVENLAYETLYIFAVAVESVSGDRVVETLSHTTGAKPDGPMPAPANTYVVSRSGTFRFKTEKVSGEPIGNIVSADWIWATKQSENDTTQDLIGDVSYADGVIEFTATGKRGNAVIAAFDAANTVVWEWLIWCTEQPDEMEYASGAVFLDRALGATSADPADGTRTWGDILYQWGRLAPIFSGYADEWGEAEVFNEARKWTVMNPDYDFAWKVVHEAATVAGAIAAPTTFFVGGKGQWIAREDRTLWDETKTDYDPCPAGYRLPVPDEWGTLLDDLDVAADESGATYTYNGKSAYYPKQNNGRMFDTGENIVGFSGFTYWNTSYILFDTMGLIGSGAMTEEEAIEMGLAHYGPSRIMYQFDPESTGHGTKMAANPAFAFSVRCVRE